MQARPAGQDCGVPRGVPGPANRRQDNRSPGLTKRPAKLGRSGTVTLGRSLGGIEQWGAAKGYTRPATPAQPTHRGSQAGTAGRGGARGAPGVALPKGQEGTPRDLRSAFHGLLHTAVRCPSGERSALAGSGSVGDTRARVEPPSRPRSFRAPRVGRMHWRCGADRPGRPKNAGRELRLSVERVWESSAVRRTTTHHGRQGLRSRASVERRRPLHSQI